MWKSNGALWCCSPWRMMKWFKCMSSSRACRKQKSPTTVSPTKDLEEKTPYAFIWLTDLNFLVNYSKVSTKVLIGRLSIAAFFWGGRLCHFHHHAPPLVWCEQTLLRHQKDRMRARLNLWKKNYRDIKTNFLCQTMHFQIGLCLDRWCGCKSYII